MIVNIFTALFFRVFYNNLLILLHSNVSNLNIKIQRGLVKGSGGKDSAGQGKSLDILKILKKYLIYIFVQNYEFIINKT